MTNPRLLRAVGDFVFQLCQQTDVPLIGLSGSQGSGKSTLAKALAQDGRIAVISLDDVYLTRAERAELGLRIHPLLATRGPPLTHDLDLLRQTLEALRQAAPDDLTPLPAFDKLADDRKPEADWPRFQGRPEAIVLEGWCVGCRPQPDEALAAPINALEAEQDQDGTWRRAINAALEGPYADMWDELDGHVHLSAPSFDVVLDWRCQQEEGLLGHTLPAGRREELAHFVAHYERLTRWMIERLEDADLPILLDENRQPIGI